MDVVLDPVEHADRVRRALTPQDTITTLRTLDIDLEDLRTVTGVDERTIRRWIEGDKPREQHRDALDRLRIAVLYILLREAIDPPDIAHWLRSRTFDLGPDPEHVARRPLDAIRDNRLGDVIIAVNAMLHPPSLDLADELAERLKNDAARLGEDKDQAHSRAVKQSRPRARAKRPPRMSPAAGPEDADESDSSGVATPSGVATVDA